MLKVRIQEKCSYQKIHMDLGKLAWNNPLQDKI